MTRTASGDPFFEKGLPSNPEAERSILGAILLDNRVCNQAIELLRREDFFLDSHRRIYDKMVALTERGMPIDLITLSDELRRAAEFEQIGGATYIASLIDGVPRTDTIEHYAKIVKQKAMLRRLITASNQIIARAFDEEDDPDIIIDQAEQMIFQIAEDRVRQGFQYIGDVAQRRLEQIEQMAGRPEMITGVPTGFTDFDQMTSGLQRQDLIIIAARPSMGKAQPLDAKVLTEAGWKSMGEIEAGDDLASIDGRPSTVIGVFPQGVKQIYRVTFSDGRTTEACGEHLWQVHYRQWPEPKVITTDEVRSLLKRKRYQKRLWIDLFAGDFGHNEPLPIDPWVLGVLIGEGDFNSLRFSTASGDILSQMHAGLGEEFALNYAGKYDYRIVQSAGHRRSGRYGVWPNPLKEALKILGLWGLRSESKFVPETYKTASRAVRLAMLQGLLDADGWVERTGSVRFATASEQLADDVVELARSLGGWATKNSKQTVNTYNCERRQGRMSFVVNIAYPEPASLFTLPEKRARARMARVRRKMPVFISVEPVRQVEARCIAVTHPSQLYITDDYVVTHNTALALNMAQYAAKNGHTIGIFSLEMSAEQLVSRLLCSEARVDAHRLRTGYLNREEWARLADALRRLTETQIYIDDTAGVGVLEMRAKTRRLKAERGLDMLIIDYLQLMSGRGRIESRQQEVSQISRDLKGLAKELDVPVVALSQLSRAPEQRSEHKPQLSDLRECVSGNTLLIDAETGLLIPINKLEAGRRILALGSKQRINAFTIDDVWSTGKKPIYELRTRTNRSIRATANHPFLTPYGWKRLEELRLNDLIATVLRLPVHGEEKNERAGLCRFLGYMTGDGTSLRHREVGFISADEKVFVDVKRLVTKHFPDVEVRRKASPYFECNFVKKYQNGYGKPGGNPLREWLKQVDAFGKRDSEKRVPEWVLEAGLVGAREFLAGYFAADGCVQIRHTGTVGRVDIRFDTTSRLLAEDVRHLLVRLGMASTISKGYLSKKATKPIYRISIAGAENLSLFTRTIPVIGVKAILLEEAERIIRTRAITNPGLLALPRGLSSYLHSIAPGWRDQGKKMRRETCSRWAEKLESRVLEEWGNSDLLWEEIAEIAPAGEDEVFDIRVPDANNFIGNGIVAHNSGAIEQDADVVSFIFREEVYNQTEENRGKAELIVAKQRNGPTGSVEIAFLKEFTRFENMWHE